MNRQQIENHPTWKYISTLSMSARYTALFVSNKIDTEKFFNVKVKEYPFSALSEIPEEFARISVTDPFRGISLIAVLENKR
jgi:hypothetical protein